MGWTTRTSIVAFLALTGLALTPDIVRAQDSTAPRENLMKACGDKWRTVREAETAKGVTWPQYLSACRAQASAASVPPAAGEARKEASKETSQEPRQDAAAKPAPSKPARQAALGGASPVFPQDVASRHASERPALARQRTCADQFKANKTTDANGGLRWIEKGGGYWSQCNAHLKQARA